MLYTQQLLEKIVLGSSIKESLEWAAAPGNLPVSNVTVVTVLIYFCST
jgi:hypothetical protein